MTRTPILILVALVSAAAVSSAFAQDAAAPLRRSSPSPVEEQSTPAATATPAATPVPSETPKAAPAEAQSSTAATAEPQNSPAMRKRVSSSSVRHEKPVRAVEPRSAWARRRPWDDPPGFRGVSRPTFDLASLGDGSVGSAIRRLEERWEAAIRAHDVRIVSELLANDFVATSTSGRVGSKSKVLSEIRRDKTIYKVAEARNMSVRTESDNVAVVTGVARESGAASDGKRFSNSRRFTDTWVKRNGKWRCIASQATQLGTR